MPYPKVSIQYCTQCKWMLRAAWIAQELLSTFSTSIGEVSLVPSKGGTFIVTLSTETQKEVILWDRKKQDGFPEAKELKRRVRDILEPERNLGHVDGNKAVKELCESCK
ncbi:hypothetical protein NEOLI_003130 [Neolecta irregularis DAH-3]|uniref:Selenoprotein W n=1 Tax=Neolecta irregularis (strain DAH-3) TaxID=1198029 RepID=A0A1U7LMN5_NEOID|nr:hypothetical protein NEOLI_003130 [Neolecta irregularis DAH-3]|eukprot:OLL23930.1 hypothetical protein NEOLI_003130 [Neolecta irregularis DAH-3]